MSTIEELEGNIKSIIDDLKGILSQQGLANQGAEEEIISTVFLYKFLNDKFMYNIAQFAKERGVSLDDVLKNKNHELDRFRAKNSMSVAFDYEDTINYLSNKVKSDTFYQDFDAVLKHIAERDENAYFGLQTSEGQRKPLFRPLSEIINSPSKQNIITTSIFAILSQERFDFGIATDKKFDFYSAIFEYLIKDYNVAAGTYAEYFTPQTVSSIIAKILVGMSPERKGVEIYDPSAGSGSLILHLANELGSAEGINRATVYTQDISNKSARFLRLNMMINDIAESLEHVVEGDTLLNPAHYTVENDPSSGLKKFDYITSNPPFKMDFSSTRDSIENKWRETDRFFAGIPKIPNKKKDSMSIYLLFIQHIIFSLKEGGKAAVVVPTGFLTAQSGIEYTIRERLVKNKMLKGVVSMPSNIFANTGTNVSVLFFENTPSNENVILIDASKLGTKVKDGKNQRTVLSDDEISKIIQTFINRDVVDDFSVYVSFDEMELKKCSFSAGQYFDVKIEYVEITKEEFQEKLLSSQEKLSKLFIESQHLESEILSKLNQLEYTQK